MATINLGNASPTEGEIRHIDLKQANIQVQPVTLDTPSLTPATTPDQHSPSEEVMAGKKIFSLEQPTDKARELAAKLTLEEQVRTFLSSPEKSLDPYWRQIRGRMMLSYATYFHTLPEMFASSIFFFVLSRESSVSQMVISTFRNDDRFPDHVSCTNSLGKSA
jgi:hypothetical protein